MNSSTGTDKTAADREVLPAQRPTCDRIQLPKFGDQPIALDAGPEAASAVEAYKSLRSRIMKAQESRGTTSVVITSTAHGEGKTLTAFNLAVCCAQLAEIKVLLIDADMRTQGLTSLVGQSAQPGLRQVLTGAVPYANALAATDFPNLSFLGAGTGDDSPAEILSTASWSQFLAWASESFTLILIDAPPAGVVADFGLIEAGCQGSLIVVRAHRTTQRALQHSMEQIDLKKVIGVVWNEAPSPQRYSYGYYKS